MKMMMVVLMVWVAHFQHHRNKIIACDRLRLLGKFEVALLRLRCRRWQRWLVERFDASRAERVCLFHVHFHHSTITSRGEFGVFDVCFYVFITIIIIMVIFFVAGIVALLVIVQVVDHIVVSVVTVVAIVVIVDYFFVRSTTFVLVLIFVASN